MYSGRVNPLFILEAFRSGADGVLFARCHPGDCHYISGNFKAQRRVITLKRLLEQFGLKSERLRLEWASSSEGERFATIIKDMTEELKRLRPSPLRTGG